MNWDTPYLHDCFLCMYKVGRQSRATGPASKVQKLSEGGEKNIERNATIYPLYRAEFVSRGMCFKFELRLFCS